MKRDGWVKESGRGKVLVCWVHESGWRVRHCGHPTAIWPYHAETPEGRMVVSFNGLGFQTLELAMMGAELAALAPDDLVTRQNEAYGALLCLRRYLGPRAY